MKPISSEGSKSYTSETSSEEIRKTGKSETILNHKKTPNIKNTKKNSNRVSIEKHDIDKILADLSHDIKLGSDDKVIKTLSEKPFLINLNFLPNKDTIFIHACLHGSTNLVKAMMKLEGFNIEARGANGNRPLLAASIANRPEIVQLLLENSAIIYMQNENGMDAVLAAACYGCLDVLKLLQAHGANMGLSYDEFSYETPLIMAAANNQESIVKYILKTQASSINRADNRGMTPLMHAITNGSSSCIRMLMSHESIDFAAKDKRGRNALMHAVESDNLAVVKELARSSDINAIALGGHSAFHMAIVGKNEAMINFFLKEMSEKLDRTPVISPVVLAASQGDLSLVKRLLEAGFSLENRDVNSGNAVLEAARNGRVDVLEYFIKKFGRNEDLLVQAATQAAGSGSIDSLRILKRYVKNIFTKNTKDGDWSAVFSALKNNQIEVLKYMLKHDANFFKSEQNRITPFEYALKNNIIEVVDLVLDSSSGKSIDLHDTSLHYLREFINSDPPMYIVEKFANKNFLENGRIKKISEFDAPQGEIFDILEFGGNAGKNSKVVDSWVKNSKDIHLNQFLKNGVHADQPRFLMEIDRWMKSKGVMATIREFVVAAFKSVTNLQLVLRKFAGDKDPSQAQLSRLVSLIFGAEDFALNPATHFFNLGLSPEAEKQLNELMTAQCSVLGISKSHSINRQDNSMLNALNGIFFECYDESSSTLNSSQLYSFLTNDLGFFDITAKRIIKAFEKVAASDFKISGLNNAIKNSLASVFDGSQTPEGLQNMVNARMEIEDFDFLNRLLLEEWRIFRNSVGLKNL